MSKTHFRCIAFIVAGIALENLIGCNSVKAVPPAKPTVTLTASATAINLGQSVTINWQMANATSVTITATAGSSTKTLTTSALASGSVTDTPTQNTTYTAVATGSGGMSSPQTANVTVSQPPPPQITSFTATPTVVSNGQTSTLTWATTNATSVTITPAVPVPDDANGLPTSGSSTTPITGTTTFNLTATGPGGTAGPQSVTVTVPFLLSFTASASTITPSQSVTLAWQVTSVPNGTPPTSLEVTDGSGNTVCNPCALPQGTATVSPTTTTTYTATAAITANTSVTQSATVTVSNPVAGAIKHIFFMLQENRSFDNYFGQLPGYRTSRLAQFGITDTQTVDGTPNPPPVLTQHNTTPQVKVSPFHEKTVCTENLTPSWDESHHDVDLSGGDGAWATTTTYTNASFAMDNFLDTALETNQNDPYGTRTMGYYNQTDLPYYYDLATFFPISDSWHSPELANTVPNRMYLMAATSFGHEYPDNGGHPQYAAPTIFRAMNTANVSWLYYYKDGIFLANFADYNDPNIGPKTFPVSDLLSRLAGTCSGSPCDPDTALPQVIFIDSASGASALDEHPDNNPQSGAAYVEGIINALMNSDAWKDSVFILTYDEGGGLYDHVPPFMVPLPDSYGPGQCPDPNNGSPGYCMTGQLGGTFNLTGFRVPVMVISPWAKPNFVSHTPRDYTAILAFIEETFNVKSLTARDAYWTDPSRDMSEFFDFASPALMTGPNNTPWTQVLNAQTTTGVCDPTQEAGPTQ
jgi:phospholipase C